MEAQTSAGQVRSGQVRSGVAIRWIEVKGIHLPSKEDWDKKCLCGLMHVHLLVLTTERPGGHTEA